jgi:Tol biopolymer transport system component
VVEDFLGRRFFIVGGDHVMKQRETAVLRIVGMICCFGLIGGCSTPLKMQRAAQISSRGGFVSEIDEPSSRGVLKRISPEECNVFFRFCLSTDEKNIVYSAVQGRTSIFSSNVSGPAQLWQISAKGGAPVKITSGGNINCEYPSFTADGNFIVYSSGGNLWKIQCNGAGGRTRIPGSGAGYDVAPHVSRDGRVAFCSEQTAGQRLTSKYFIWICNLDGSNLTQLREGMYPTWSPDCQKLVFVHNGDIWFMGVDGTELTQLTHTPYIYEGFPSFSPDGKSVVYVSNEGKDGKPMSSDFNIWTMRIDGLGKTQLTELSSWDSWPVWGEDGIYFLSGRAAIDMTSRLQRIWKLEIKGMEQKRVTASPNKE